jgi:hypothetical protein
MAIRHYFQPSAGLTGSTVKDVVGGFHLPLIAAPTLNGNYLALNGTTQGAEITSLPQYDTTTMIIVAKPSSVAGFAYLAAYENTGGVWGRRIQRNPNPGISFHQNVQTLNAMNQGAEVAVGTVVWAGLTDDGAIIRCYVNGLLIGSMRRSGVLAAAPRFAYGVSATPNASFFAGDLGDCLIADHKMSVREMWNHVSNMRSRFAGLTSIAPGRAEIEV